MTNLTGHGMGCYNLHAGLTIANYDDGNPTKIKKDMMIAIGPFATNGGARCELQAWKHLPHPAGPGGQGRRGHEAHELDKRELPRASVLRTLVHRPRSWAQLYLKTLVRHGILYAYPILTEIKGGMVSRTEHTVVLNGYKRGHHIRRHKRGERHSVITLWVVRIWRKW